VNASNELARLHLKQLAVERVPSLSEFATAPLYCGLATLSPLIRAVMDASEGKPIPKDLERHFGGNVPREPRRTVAIRSGGRAGKTSRLVSVKALHAAWTVPLPTLQHGEVATSLLVAPDLKLGRQALSFAAGYVDQSPLLRAALVKEPTQEGLLLERPDGKRVRVEVLAATRGGRAVRARTLVFAGLDEAAFFYSADTGVINDADIYNAVFQRVVPGGQVWIVSTPWVKGVGLLEKFIEEDFGRHHNALVCVGGTRAFNPTWDPEGVIEQAMRAQDPDAARREIDGEPLSGTASAFFEGATIEACIDASIAIPLSPQPGDQVCAGADMGFRSDSSAGCVTYRRGKKIIVADLLEKRPADGVPLKPSEVVADFAAAFLRHAGLAYVVADDHYRESITELLSGHNLSYKPAPAGSDGVSASYVRARALMREGRVAIPNHPRLLAQLRSVQWRPNVGGSISIVLPRERAGGHCDLVSAFVLAVWESAGLEVEEAPTIVKIWEQHWKEPEKLDDPLERAMMEAQERAEYEEKFGEGGW
jgi:hypothetical protein